MGMRGRPRKSAGSGQVAAGSTVDQLSAGDQETGNREQGATVLPSPVKCQPVRLLTTELDGFRVFEPKRNQAGEDVIRILINRDGCRITQRCAEVLRGPDYVIAFFDEKGKRLMLKPAEKGMANAIHLKTKSAKIYPSIAAAGHQANVIQPTLIFDLGHLQVREDR